MISGKFQRKPIKKSLVEKLFDSSLGRGIVFSQARKKNFKSDKRKLPCTNCHYRLCRDRLKKGLKKGYEKGSRFI